MNLVHIDTVKVGDGVTEVLHTDREAHTVVARTARTITIQADDATLDNWKPEVIPGGFAGHCINQNSQRYTYKPCSDAVRRVLYCCKDGHFKVGGNNRPTLYEGRHKFYDYNF